MTNLSMSTDESEKLDDIPIERQTDGGRNGTNQVDRVRKMEYLNTYHMDLCLLIVC